jgi:hypothetical protein
MVTSSKASPTAGSTLYGSRKPEGKESTDDRRS